MNTDNSCCSIENTDSHRQLFLRQKEMLKMFLERKAISKEQFEKSYEDLKTKMGFDDDGNTT